MMQLQYHLPIERVLRYFAHESFDRLKNSGADIISRLLPTFNSGEYYIPIAQVVVQRESNIVE